jgi:hypothetical protein
MIHAYAHLKAVDRILSYLNMFIKGRLIIDTSHPGHNYILLKTIQTGWNSIQMLVKRFQRILLLKKDQESG